MAFFIIYSPNGETPPKRQHDTHGAALHEAHRLASKQPGSEFFVMRSCSKPVTAEVQAHG